MRKNPYRSGDAIFLKAGVLGANQPKGPGRVVTALPETQQGAVRYRVRFQHENFERNIALDEIDVAASSSRPWKSKARLRALRDRAGSIRIRSESKNSSDGCVKEISCRYSSGITM